VIGVAKENKSAGRSDAQRAQLAADQAGRIDIHAVRMSNNIILAEDLKKALLTRLAHRAGIVGYD